MWHDLVEERLFTSRNRLGPCEAQFTKAANRNKGSRSIEGHEPHVSSQSVPRPEECGVYAVAFKYAFVVEKRDNLAVFHVRQSALEADDGHLIKEMRDDLEWARGVSE